MTKKAQINLRLDEIDSLSLKRVADRERRSEQEVLRESLRCYAQNSDENEAFLRSVEEGWYEAEAGLGEIVEEDDDFLASVIRKIRHEADQA